MTTKWNPDFYLKFQHERTQPPRDLVKRIELGRVLYGIHRLFFVAYRRSDE